MKTKLIVYRGGIVTFEIPEGWVEEYEEEGGGTFYEPGDDTGTLRLNVLSFEAHKDVGMDHPQVVFEQLKSERDAEVFTLSDNRYLMKYSLPAEENGERLLIHYWEVSRMISARKSNIAVFSYTIAEDQSIFPSMKDEIANLDRLIRKVEFGIY